MRKYASALEIVAVILLIALIAGIALPAYNRSKDKAKEAEVKNNLHEIQVAVETYTVDHEGQIPPYLIGGDIRYDSKWDDIYNNEHPLTEIQIRSIRSDPILSSGYFDSYPSNPFMNQRNALDLLRLQESVKDPLRNDKSLGDPAMGALGKIHGCRFGGSGMVMGNVSCDYRYPTFETKKPDGTIVAHYPSGADFDGYPFFDVWEDNHSKLYLPGEFFYKTAGWYYGPVSNLFDASKPKKPMYLDQYILGAYGSVRNIGEDIFGPEQEVKAYSYSLGEKIDGLPRAYLSMERLQFEPSRNQSKRIPVWTRWLNTTDESGNYPGSPYSIRKEKGGQIVPDDIQYNNEKAIALEELAPGNPNGIKDAIVLVLSARSEPA